jgi:DNA-binding NarL/FixJ family response regulator
VMTTVLLADDHRLVRAGLALLLATAADITVVGEATDGRQAVERARELEPDVILMDLSMPVLDGIEATRQILGGQPQVRVVALTSFADQPKVAAMLEVGAVGYLLKDCEPADLLSAIRAAGASGPMTSPPPPCGPVTICWRRQAQTSRR